MKPNKHWLKWKENVMTRREIVAEYKKIFEKYEDALEQCYEDDNFRLFGNEKVFKNFWKGIYYGNDSYFF